MMMKHNDRWGRPETQSKARSRMLGLLPVIGLAVVSATDAGAAAPGFCTATARTQLAACRGEAIDEYSTATAICINESNSADRATCNRDAATARTEKADLCDDQLEARIDVCAGVGEGRYDPAFNEARFVSDHRFPGVTNPYQPLAIGNTWDYASQDETSHI